MRSQSVSSTDGATAWHSAIAACSPYAPEPAAGRARRAPAPPAPAGSRPVPPPAVLLLEQHRLAVARPVGRETGPR